MHGWLALLTLVCLPAGVRAGCCEDCIAKLRASDQDYADAAILSDCYDVIQCNTVCGIGQQYRISCSSVIIPYGNAFPQNILCEACPAGKYRSNVNAQPVCDQCTVCQSNQKQTVACTPATNRQCQTCGSGFIVVGGVECVSCNSGSYPGTYANAGQTACLPCQNCGVSQLMKSECSSSQNRVCEACPPNARSLTLNAGSCNGCFQYYVRGASACAPCDGDNAACSAGYYINCLFSEALGGYRTCEVCSGQVESPANRRCPEGTGVSLRCTGKTLGDNLCLPCARGTERKSTTTLVDNLYQGCTKCLIGTFKSSDGTQFCVACTNKPVNSQYVAWASNQNDAITSNCPWVCNAGYLRVGDACNPCGTGTYSATAGATSCSVCTNKPASNTYYLARLASNIPTGNDCPWECTTGYVRSGATCVQCQTGKYRVLDVTTEGSVNQCVTCSACQAQVPPNADGLNGVQGSFTVQECVFNRDRVCQSCNVACGADRYIRTRCNTTNDLDCVPCATRCPAGFYLSSKKCTGNAIFDEVLAGCIPCLSFANCTGDYYLSKACTGSDTTINSCLFCSKNLPCPTGQYRLACSGFSDTTCQPYRTCAAGEYLSDETLDRDGVCTPCSSCGPLTVVRPCTRTDDIVCKGFSVCGRTVPCPLLSTTNRSALFCDYSLGEGLATCGVCPPGYGSNGQYCLECPRGYTCDRVGGTACRGQCQAGVLSTCDFNFGLGYAQCELPWQKCETVYSNSRRPWRGSYVGADAADCAAYFLCTAGTYKNFSTGGTVGCESCNATLLPTLGALDRFVTEGLSVEDDASCLWDCRAERASLNPATGLCVAKAGRENGFLRNAAGFWTSITGTSEVCGEGQTSQEDAAMLKADCLACQPLPGGNVMRWKPRTTQCESECLQPRDTKRGSQCIPERPCTNREGLLVAGGVCALQTFPWNAAGYEKTGWLAEKSVASVSASRPLQYPLMSSLGYGIKDRHTVTAFAGATPRKVEGALCSSTTGWVGGRQYVFASLCNQSFLVYLDLARAGTGLGVLIGNGTRGWRDGFRTQALFESELYVAGTGNGTLFVLDRWNCLLREVVVWDRPGSYLTRVYTLWGNTAKLALAVPEAKCYGDGSLAWPRRFWTLSGDWLAFGDEDGLWQFNTVTRELLTMLREDTGGFEVDNLISVALPSPSTLVLGFQDRAVWSVQARQEPCPQDRTSLFGGSCTVTCNWKNSAQKPSQYVDPVTGLCRPCTTPVCGNGQELVACTPTADAYCRSCEFGQDGSCGACPFSSQAEGASRCIKCSIGAIGVAGSPELFTDGLGGNVYRFKSSGAIRFEKDTRADVLVIGGGGAGGTAIGGGGGAGTLVLGMNTLFVGGVNYTVVVGAGGKSTTSAGTGGSGQASSIGSLVSAAGGGGGGAWSVNSVLSPGNGGSGGGAGACRPGYCGTTVWTGPSSSKPFERANVGGTGSTTTYGTGFTNYLLHGGGGGGAGTAGENHVTGTLASCSTSNPTACGTCGRGGSGLGSMSVSGTTYSFTAIFGVAYTGMASAGLIAAGGGGGAFWQSSSTASSCLGGSGGGGTGYQGSSTISTPQSVSGVTNTGSGGGGGADGVQGGNGGSGLVLIKLSGDITTSQQQGVQLCACQTRSSLWYSADGTCDAGVLRPSSPCQPGWYASGGGAYCEPCPPYTATVFSGAVRREQCRCLDGLVKKNGGCVAEDLYEFEGFCAGRAACNVPFNAQLVAWDGVACRWACNAGYYRDSLAGFLDRCRPCLVGQGRTRGDDDEPWSCE